MTDSRILSWRALFDESASFCVIGGPDWLSDQLNTTSSSSSRGLMTWGKVDASLYQLGDYDRLVAVNDPRSSPEQFLEAGFSWVRSFAILPSIDDPRFLIPLESPRAASRGLYLYSPASMKGRAARRAGILAARAGTRGWYRDHIMIATRELPAVEQRLRKILGTSQLHLAFSTGRPLAQQKRTIGVLDPAGVWRCFLKQGEGPWAGSALENEANWLRSMACSRLANTVPRLLDYKRLDDSTRILLSAGPEHQSTDHIQSAHLDWLTTLGSETATAKPYSASNLAQRLCKEWPTLRRSVSTEWCNRIDGAAAHLHRELSDQILPLSAAHGDFTPWNIRQCPDKGLYVFDWEMARDNSLPLHDLFHFNFMKQILMGRTLSADRARKWIEKHSNYLEPGVNPRLVTTLFAAFLTDLALTYLDLLVARQGSGDDVVLTAIVSLLDRSNLWWVKAGMDK